MTYNLRGERVPGGTLGARHVAQFEALARWSPHFLCVQEGRFFRQVYKRMLYQAEEILGMRGVLAPSAHDDCDLVTFIRPDVVRITEERHRGHPFWHGMNVLRCVVGGGLKLDVINYHGAPDSASLRAAEGECMKLLMKREREEKEDEGGGGKDDRPLRVLVGDFNAIPVNHPVAGQERGKQDRRPALEMGRQGWVDAGEVAGDRTPTVGHFRAGQLAYRCDRVLSTFPPEWLARYWVVRDMDHVSDHRAAGADYAIPGAEDGLPE
ncbi:endonuclease/exonuclease/phosphatase family protein [Acrocarpospora pleiomorpha]|nr:endonuclease/exonuclease/phosphatase family protein [Acrocarpospora pleiomorpha]